MTQEIRRECLISPYNQRNVNRIILTYKIEKTTIYSWDIMWNEMWDEWVRSFSSRIITTDNRFDSQTKSLTFNPKIYYHDNARDRNNLMRKSKADDSWMFEDLILLSYCLHWLKVFKIGWLDKNAMCVVLYNRGVHVCFIHKQN